MALKYEPIVNGPFQENCFLVFDDDTGKGIFIDPGAEPERLMSRARSAQVEIIGIYNTHGHIDHVGGVAVIKETLKVPFAMHSEDGFLLQSLPDQARMFGIKGAEIPDIDIHLKDGDTVEVGSLKARVIHTPGHSPGGVCFAFDTTVFVGDTLFAGSIGRSDLPGGSLDTLLSSIKERLLGLGDDVIALSGHGPSTTIGEERLYNPFLTGRF